MATTGGIYSAKEGGAEAFEWTLAEAAERFGWGVHAYVVMRNHFHLSLPRIVRSVR